MLAARIALLKTIIITTVKMRLIAFIFFFFHIEKALTHVAVEK